VSDLLNAMRADAEILLAELRVDGGGARNNLLMQFQADLLGVAVVRPVVTETTALGAAYLAGLAVDFWKSRQELETQWQVERRFEPQMPLDRAQCLRHQWNRTLERVRNWEERPGA
jgi:glycerol kinase